jgi:hypothetical protein
MAVNPAHPLRPLGEVLQNSRVARPKTHAIAQPARVT